MPRLIVPEGRTETLVDAINYLLAREGAGALSLRSIARVSRVSTSSMLHHFGSREPPPLGELTSAASVNELRSPPEP